MNRHYTAGTCDKWLPAATFPLIAALISCAGTDSSAGSANIDTLPNGAVRVISTQPADSGRWSLTVERTIQPPSGAAGELLNPASLAVADDGSILVAEESPPQVKVYGPDGSFVRTIGRGGAGPGEFRVAFIAVRGDTLVVQDPRSSRMSTFNWRSGDFIAARTSVCCFWSPITVTNSGRAVLNSIASHPDSTVGHAASYVRLGLADSTVDTVFVIEGHPRDLNKSWQVKEGNQVSMMMTPPLQHQAQYAVLPSGNFLVAWSGEYMLRETSNGRDTVAIFGRTVTPVAVSAAEKEELLKSTIARLREHNDELTEASLRGQFDVKLIPSTRPAFGIFLADAEGRRWVFESQRDTTVHVIDLFDTDGRWLDVLRVPASQFGMLIAFGKQRVAVAREGDDGRPKVIVLRYGRSER